MATAAGSGFDEMFRREYPRLVRSATLIVGDRELARDVAQDAMVQAFKSWADVSGYDVPGAWARRVCIRMAVRARSQRSRRSSAEVLRVPDATDPSTIVGGEGVWQAVLTLPMNQRAAIVLRYVEDLSTDEIGDILGCDASTVRVHLHRGRKALGIVLREEVEDDVVG